MTWKPLGNSQSQLLICFFQAGLRGELWGNIISAATPVCCDIERLNIKLGMYSVLTAMYSKKTIMCMSGHSGMCAPALCLGSISDTCFHIKVTTAVTVNKKIVGNHVKMQKKKKVTGYFIHWSYTESATTNWMDFKGVFYISSSRAIKMNSE